jgi:formin-binding protein 1
MNPMHLLSETFHGGTEHRLSFLLSHSSTIYNNLYTKLSTQCSSIANAYSPLDIGSDQDLYAEFNIRAFTLPPDWSWDPCPGYYADEQMIVGQGGGEEVVYLQNRLGKSRKEKERLTIMMNGQSGCASFLGNQFSKS